MASIHNMYKYYNFDTSHFKGQGWNKDNFHYEAFTEFSYLYKGSTTQKALIALRGRQCEHCGYTEWLGSPINLEVHHINGDRTDNRLENLQLLCPNCHSYTFNYAKQRDKRYKTDEEFVQALKDHKTINKALAFLDLAPGAGNYARAWKLIYEYNIEHLKPKECITEDNTSTITSNGEVFELA